MNTLNPSKSTDNFDTNISNVFKEVFDKTKLCKLELQNAQKELKNIENLSNLLTKSLRAFNQSIET